MITTRGLLELQSEYQLGPKPTCNRGVVLVGTFCPLLLELTHIFCFVCAVLPPIWSSLQFLKLIWQIFCNRTTTYHGMCSELGVVSWGPDKGRTVLISMLDWLVVIVCGLLWYPLFPPLVSSHPDLLNGFVALPNYVLPESTRMLWEMLQSYKEVRHLMP